MLHGLQGRRGHGRRHGAARGSLQALPLPHRGAGARSLGSGPGCPQLRKARSHLRWAGKGLNPWPQPQGLPRPRPRPPNTQAHPAVHGPLTTERRSARRYGHRSEPRAHRLRSPGRPGNPGRCPTQALGTGQRPLTLPQGPLPTPRDKELPAQSPKAASAPPAPPTPDMGSHLETGRQDSHPTTVGMAGRGLMHWGLALQRVHPPRPHPRKPYSTPRPARGPSPESLRPWAPSPTSTARWEHICSQSFTACASPLGGSLPGPSLSFHLGTRGRKPT